MRRAVSRFFLAGALLGLYEEGACNAADDPSAASSMGTPTPLMPKPGHGQRAGGNDGAHIAFVQVGAHAGHVAHVIAHIVGNDGGVAGVVLGDAGLHLAHQVGAHVGRFGEDAAAHTGEQSHAGSAHAEGKHVAGDVLDQKIGGGHGATVVYQNLRKKYQMERSRRPRPTTVKPMTLPAENATRRPLVQAVLGGVGGAAVGHGGRFHADEAGQAAEKSRL